MEIKLLQYSCPVGLNGFYAYGKFVGYFPVCQTGSYQLQNFPLTLGEDIFFNHLLRGDG